MPHIESINPQVSRHCKHIVFLVGEFYQLQIPLIWSLVVKRSKLIIKEKARRK